MAKTPSNRPALQQASVEQLVAIVQVAGDSAAFNELFGRFERKLRAFLLYKSSDSKFEVDDLMQETYVKAFLHIGQYQQQAEFSTWLLRIAINELLQAKRAQGIFARLKQRWFHSEPEAQSHTDLSAEQRDAASLLTSSAMCSSKCLFVLNFMVIHKAKLPRSCSCHSAVSKPI